MFWEYQLSSMLWIIPWLKGLLRAVFLGHFWRKMLQMVCTLCIMGTDSMYKLVFAVHLGESIASEGSGEYMFVEGYVRSTSGKPIANASIETWETDSHGKLRDCLPLQFVLGLASLWPRLLRYPESCSWCPWLQRTAPHGQRWKIQLSSCRSCSILYSRRRKASKNCLKIISRVLKCNRDPLASCLVYSSAITCVPIIYISWSKHLVFTSLSLRCILKVTSTSLVMLYSEWRSRLWW